MKRKLAALAMAMVLVLSLCACGEFDASGYVNGMLTAIQTGEVSDEVAELSYESKEELQKEIDDMYAEIEDELIEMVGEEAVTDSMRENVNAYAKNFFAALKYEVAEESVKTDKGYEVEVTVYPLTALENFEEYLDGEFTEKWMDKAAEYSDEDTFMKDFYEDFLAEIAAYFGDSENLTYADPETVTVRIEEKDDCYELNENDVDALFSKMINE